MNKDLQTIISGSKNLLPNSFLTGSQQPQSDSFIGSHFSGSDLLDDWPENQNVDTTSSDNRINNQNKKPKSKKSSRLNNNAPFGKKQRQSIPRNENPTPDSNLQPQNNFGIDSNQNAKPFNDMGKILNGTPSLQGYFLIEIFIFFILKLKFVSIE